MAGPRQTELLALLSTKPLHPHPNWLTPFLASQRPTTPLPALVSTATFRILASDITTTLSSPPHAVLPSDIQSTAVKERRLPTGKAGEIIVQVLDVEDIGKSRWSQVEEIEALERGEGTRGREIIRVEVPEVEGNGAGPGPGTTGTNAQQQQQRENAAAGGGGGVRGPHKVLLQDVKGTVVYGFELTPIKGIEVGMGIGSKMVLKGCLVARGVVILEPETVGWLGGKIEDRHKAWVKERKESLKAKVMGAMEED